MTGASLDRWLAWLETLHPSTIDLGLERVGAVAAALGVARPAPRVVLVAGTNGKGSVCAFLEAMLQARGSRVGLYTSPHLQHFRERARIAGAEARDEDILAALERVEAARGDIRLTFFEYTTLAVLDLFRRAGIDVAVLEVGLGGRLDATNVVEPDVSIVTSIGLDHREWLGDDRDAIAREKAGVARAGRPLLIGEREPVRGLTEAAAAIGADLRAPGAAYDWWGGADGWGLRTPSGILEGLPQPGLVGGYQLANAALAVAALDALGLEPARAVVEAGLARATVPGRFEVCSGPVEVVLDVAHNPDAAATLAAALADRRAPGRTRALLAMYRDKDVAGVVRALEGQVDAWYLAGLEGERGLAADALGARLPATVEARVRAPDPVAAFEAARGEAVAGDRIVVLGSFATVAALRRHLGRAPPG